MSLGATFARAHGELIRRAVLELLAELPHPRALDPAIGVALEAMDLDCTGDQLRGHLTWLAEQQLLVIEPTKGGHMAAELTERGFDVARGLAVVPGVSRKKFAG